MDRARTACTQQQHCNLPANPVKIKSQSSRITRLLQGILAADHASHTPNTKLSVNDSTKNDLVVL